MAPAPAAAAAAGKAKKKKKTPKWRNSNEKEVLRKDIVDFKVTEDMAAAQVYEMHNGIYKKFELKHFTTNLRNLRKSVEADRERMYFDSAAYYSDMSKQRPPRSQTKPHWNTHVAKDLLEIDLDEGLNTVMTPLELWLTRGEYQVFELEVFRKHIHQAVGARLKKEYWEDFKTKKQQGKAGRKR